MTFFVAVVCGCLGLTGVAETSARTPENLRLPEGRDFFFAEDNLVYSRFLRFDRDGTYQQINRDRFVCAEADRGTWEQGTDGAVRLHSSYRGLRFRALRAGPLNVMLDSAEKIETLSAMLAKIRRWLRDTREEVFAADAAGELSVPPGAVSVDRAAETFRREDLQALAAQMEDAVQTEQTRTYILTPTRVAGGPCLLVLRGAVFGAERIEAVGREYHVPRGGAPPFYFARTGAAAFAKKVGHWREIQLAGGLAAP